MKSLSKHTAAAGLLLLLASIGLSSCMVGKRYTAPELQLPQSFAPDRADSLTLADVQWWEVYTDTTLQKLIRKALEHNKDLLTATERIRETAYRKRIQTAGLLPEISAKVAGEREFENYGGKGETASNTFEGKLLFSWEIDLWGHLRWGRQKSIAEYLESVQARRALQITLIAQVAQSYFELMALDNELEIVQQTLAIRQEGVHQAKIRFEGGLTSEITYQQALVEQARTATLIPELEREIAATENDLSLLTGAYPGGGIPRGTLPQGEYLPESLPVGLPSTLLQRRPDLMEAEQRLIAANAAVGMAYTDRFPRLVFSGVYGLETDVLSTLFKSPYGLIGGNLLSPIFATGKKKAAYKAEQAAYQQAVYQYEKSVQNAFREVSDAIVAYNKAREAHQLKQRLEQSAKKYMELAQYQYINGVIRYLDVLDAQREYFDAQTGLSNAVRDEQIALVQLYKALGGGWNPEDDPQRKGQKS